MSGLTARSASRPSPRLIAAFAVGAAGLAITGGGVYAALNATAFNTTAQNATSGVLSLTMADNGTGFSQGVSNLAPGDVVNRYVDLTQAGSLNAADLSLGVTATPATKLTTDPVKGLHVTVTRCIGGSWVVSGTGAGDCAGTGATTSALAQNLPLSSLVAGSIKLNGMTDVPAGTTLNLKVSLTLPNQDETTINGVHHINGLPAGSGNEESIQGLSSALTWTFSETQRAGTTTGS